MGYFWNMANTLQVITFMTLINMKIPVSTSDVFLTNRNIVTFDIIPENLRETIIKSFAPQLLQNQIALSSKFEMEDFGNQFIMVEMFSNLLFLILYIII